MARQELSSYQKWWRSKTPEYRAFTIGKKRLYRLRRSVLAHNVRVREVRRENRENEGPPATVKRHPGVRARDYPPECLTWFKDKYGKFPKALTR